MEDKKENKLRSRDMFYAIIALATLIVAIIGATLAYFSIVTSSAEGAVNAAAATVSINYMDGKQVSAAANQLIPASLNVVKAAYNKVKDTLSEDNADTNVCTDDNDKQVCSIYRFSIQSDSERTVTAKLLNESNLFTYLSYAVYDVTNNAWLNLEGNNQSSAMKYCNNENTDPETNELITNDDCFTVTSGVKNYTNPSAGAVGSAVNSIFGLTTTGGNTTFTEKTVSSTEQVYDILLFIEENNEDQNIDQGATYSGTIQVEVTDSGSSSRITGFINGVN